MRKFQSDLNPASTPGLITCVPPVIFCRSWIVNGSRRMIFQRPVCLSLPKAALVFFFECASVIYEHFEGVLEDISDILFGQRTVHQRQQQKSPESIGPFFCCQIG